MARTRGAAAEGAHSVVDPHPPTIPINLLSDTTLSVHVCMYVYVCLAGPGLDETESGSLSSCKNHPLQWVDIALNRRPIRPQHTHVQWPIAYVTARYTPRTKALTISTSIIAYVTVDINSSQTTRYAA